MTPEQIRSYEKWYFIFQIDCRLIGLALNGRIFDLAREMYDAGMDPKESAIRIYNNQKTATNAR